MQNRLYSSPERRERNSPILCTGNFSSSLFLQGKGKKKQQKEKSKKKEELHNNEVEPSSHTSGEADNNIWF